MSSLRFNHVFAALLLLSAFSAFVLSPAATNRLRNLQGLFAPIARPVGRVAFALHQRLAAPETPDARTAAELRAENQRLQTLLLSVTGQLQEMRRRDADRALVGDLRPLCTPIDVLGPELGAGESLALRGDPALAEGQPVISAGGLVGRLDRAGPAGAQVRLVTDKSFRATARFVRLDKSADAVRHVPLPITQPLVQGDGRGGLLIASYPEREAREIQPGDHVVLDDPDWPANIKGQPLGEVVSKTPRRDAPLFVELHARPVQNLRQLREVMVLTR